MHPDTKTQQDPACRHAWKWRSSLVAVSAWKVGGSGDHVAVVYRGSGTVWEAARVIGGGRRDRVGLLKNPYGLRISGDGSMICVAGWSNNRPSVIRVGDGGFVRHIAKGLSCAIDVEEVEGGWLVACEGSDSVEFVGDGGVGGGWPSLGKVGGGSGSGDGEFDWPTALAVVPGLGLVVREWGSNRLQVFATPDAIAMAAMSCRVSCMRVAWMVAVARAVVRRIP
jgi:hypothetical protein